MEQQWEIFVTCTKAKAESHQQVARFWSAIETGFGLSLILISASITAVALVSFIPPEAVAGLAAVSTTLASVAAFLKASDKRTFHERAAANFRSLTVQMISCKTAAEYERLWIEFNREVTDEPMVPKRFAPNSDMAITMRPELHQVITEKKRELGVDGCENENGSENENAYEHENGYEDKNGSENENGYEHENGCENENGHENENGYEQENGCENKNGSENENGYEHVNGCENEAKDEKSVIELGNIQPQLTNSNDVPENIHPVIFN